MPYLCNTYGTNRMWMIPNKKFNVNKRIQCKQSNFAEVKTNGEDFKMIHGVLSTPFIIEVQVFRVCHQPDTFSPARLCNPLLYVAFQYLCPRGLQLWKKIPALLIFVSFTFNLSDLQRSALHGLDSFVYIRYVNVFQCAFYAGSIFLCIFESDLLLYCLTVKGVFNMVDTFSIGLMSRLLGGIENFVAPTACLACFTAFLFWLGSPSCRNSLPVGLTFFSIVLGKWSQMKSGIICPFMLPSYCSQRITPCV